MRRRDPANVKAGRHRDSRSCRRGHKMSEPTRPGGGITMRACLVCDWTEIDLTDTAAPAKLGARKPMWQ